MTSRKKTNIVQKLSLKAKNKRKFFTYSQEALNRALFEIRENQLQVRKASREFGVPRSTLQDILKGKLSERTVRKTGPPPKLTWDGEEKLAKWLVDIAKCGFPINKKDFLSTAKKIAEDSGKSLFKNNTPGQKWYSGFLRRHPEVSLREAETINRARALVTEEGIRKWFADLQTFLETRDDFCEIMLDPPRIFNGDESGFSLCPKSGKVLAPKGFKNLYKITTGKEKENITVFLIFSADGQVCPPFVVFPYIRPPRAVVESMPPTWVLGKSEKGWMTSEAFFEYISNDFNRYLIDRNIKKPVIVFLDGHKSHMSLPLSEFCDSNGIILYALPPNSTHILQPADVSVFKPLKQEWKNTVGKWLSKPENINSSVTKLNFCALFQDTLKSTNTTTQIINGFRKCGLFPFNPDSIDYSKCVKNTLENQGTSTGIKTIYTEEDIVTPIDLEITKRVIKKIEPQLYSYGINVEVIYKELDERNQPNIEIGTVLLMDKLTILPTANIVIQNNLDAPEEGDRQWDILSDVSIIDSNGAEKTDQRPECNIEDIENSEANDISSIHINKVVIKPSYIDQSTNQNEAQMTSNEKNETGNETKTKAESSDDNIIHKTENQVPLKKSILEIKIDPFEKHLRFPEVAKIPGKAKIKLPSAISSQAWRDYYLKKDREKTEKEMNIKKRKEQRIAKQQEIENKNKGRRFKKKTVKMQGIRPIENTMDQEKAKQAKIKCVKCDEDLISDTEEEQEKNIGCDLCTKWYHLRCTEFSELPYAVAALNEYKCDTCKQVR